MDKLLALVALIGSGILGSVGAAHAAGGALLGPEPSSIALIGVAAAAFAWWYRGGRK
jgi:hypothetical protein